jgi:hypothetical protein
MFFREHRIDLDLAERPMATSSSRPSIGESSGWQRAADGTPSLRREASADHCHERDYHGRALRQTSRDRQIDADVHLCGTASRTSRHVVTLRDPPNNLRTTP